MERRLAEHAARIDRGFAANDKLLERIELALARAGAQADRVELRLNRIEEYAYQAGFARPASPGVSPAREPGA